MSLSSDLESRIHGTQKISAVVDTLAEDGIAPASVLANSGISEDTLRTLSARVSFAQIVTVFRNAVRLATDPTTAVRAGARMRLTAYGMYGYGLLSSPTHAERIDFALKYKRVMGPVAAPVAYVRGERVAIYTYEVFVTADPLDPLYRFALEFAYAAHLTVGRDLYGDGFGFSLLGFACPPPAQPYDELLGCPVRFDQPGNELHTALHWPDLPSGMPEPSTHAMVCEMCQPVLARMPYLDGLSSVVRSTLVEHMPWRFPTVEAMARHLDMHPRTLRRRLESEGTGYKDILVNVRRGLAIEYLRETRMTTEEIATRLGYSDASNFRHAFHRWTGQNPQDYRRR